MRVAITGSSKSCDALRGMCENNNRIGVVRFLPSYTVELNDGGNAIVFDSIDCLLEREILNSVRELTDTIIHISTAGGNQSDTRISILIPDNEKDRWAVETGVYRGLDKVIKKSPSFWSLK